MIVGEKYKLAFWGDDLKVLTLRQRWKPLILLSIIVPVSLLVSFRLTGVLPEPPIPETFTVEVVRWNMSRPSDFTTLDESVENVYADDAALVRWSIFIGAYHENNPDWPFDYNDGLGFRLVATANVSSGFIYSLAVKFSKIEDTAFLDIVADLKDPNWVELDNLEIKAVRDSWRTNKPYIDAMARNQPEYCSLKMASFWVFFDKNNIDHWIMASLEVKYFNGATYQAVALPIQLKVTTG